MVNALIFAVLYLSVGVAIAATIILLMSLFGSNR